MKMRRKQEQKLKALRLWLKEVENQHHQHHEYQPRHYRHHQRLTLLAVACIEPAVLH
jgi:hypothetical protein